VGAVCVESQIHQPNNKSIHVLGLNFYLGIGATRYCSLGTRSRVGESELHSRNESAIVERVYDILTQLITDKNTVQSRVKYKCAIADS
jgi:hypothetical protein